MIKVTPFDFEHDGIRGDLFSNLSRVMSSNGADEQTLNELIMSVKNRLNHPSIKLPQIDASAITEISKSLSRLNQIVFDKTKVSTVEQNPDELKTHIQSRFGMADFLVERDFDWLQRKIVEESFGDLSEKMVGVIAKDNAAEFFKRVVFPQSSIIQLVAWSACDFDLAHQIRSIKRIVELDQKHDQKNSQAYKILCWIEALGNLIHTDQMGFPTAKLKNPMMDALFAVKNATSYEMEKISRFGKTWPEERIRRAYLDSGSNIETLYFNWAISILRDVLVWAGVSKKVAMQEIEDLYGLFGVSLSWESRMWNTEGGVSKPSLPNPSHIYYQYRTLTAFFEASNLA